MHDLGQSKQEQSQMFHENTFEGPMAGEYSGESPLQEIFEHVSTYHEAPIGHEYHEAPMGHEYHEAPLGHEYHEAPMGYEYHEAPMGYEHQEAPLGHEYQETPIGYEYHESPMGHEYQEAPFGNEYNEGEFQQSEDESFSQEDELGLAAELLEIQTEEELDQFIGKLVRRVSRGASRFLRSPAGSLLKNVLRQIAKRALPIAGKALGSIVGGPLGGMAAGYLTNMAGQALGLETQGMSEDEANFASARQFVRFATNAARKAALSASNPQNVNANSIAQAAVQSAARQFAPGLLGPQYGRIRIAPLTGGRRGVWVRRGQTITLFGV